jgi:multiple sugar transport system permease protein
VGRKRFLTKSLVAVFRPLVMPGIATTALYAFLFSWTEFLGALSFLTNDGLFTPAGRAQQC